MTTDNASNNDTFLQALERQWANFGIHFDAEKQRNRCVAHIINLTVQQALATLNADASEEEDISLHLEETTDTITNVSNSLTKVLIN